MTGAEVRALLGLPAAWPLIPAVDDAVGKRPIRKWAGVDWAKYDHIQAELWGLPTGTVTGLVALDFDGAAGAKVLRLLGAEPHMRTGSGGHHLYIAAPDYPVKTVAGVRPGVDVRGEGGMVYVAGESRKGPYTALRPVTDLLPFPDLPEAGQWLLVPRPERAVVPAAVWEGKEPGTLAAVAFLLRELDGIRAAEPGTWNRTFSRAVYAVAGMVAGGCLAEEYALSSLRGIGLDEAAETTMRSSWAAGSKVPWSGGGPVTLY